MTKKKRKKAGAWIDTMSGAIGKFVHLETGDGVHREGKLTGLRTREIKMNGEDVDLPVAVELNGDPNDYIDFRTITTFDID